MSVSRDGQRIVCDEPGCKAEAFAPVGLRSVLTAHRAAAAHSVQGWLYAVCGGKWNHYCPACVPHYLVRLADSDAPGSRAQ